MKRTKWLSAILACLCLCVGTFAFSACNESETTGNTPYIGENGNWWIGETDTGIAAKGENGKDGEDGKDFTACVHSYSEWATALEETCTSIGYKTRSCTLCDKVEYEFMQATGHSYGEWTDMISTCQSRWQVRYCADCDLSQTVQATPEGHRYVEGVCEDCGADVTELYESDYGYEYLGTLKSGEALQRLYKEIHTIVREFHLDSSRNAENGVVAQIDHTAFGLTLDEATAVWKTFKGDNPLYYWLSNSIQVSPQFIRLQAVDEYALGSVRSAYNEELYSRIDEYADIVKGEGSEYMIALAYHDAIINAIDYTETALQNEHWAHSIVGVFDKKSGVCESYARTFQLLLNYSGVENVFVTGKGDSEDHAWNLVKLDDGLWYWCDLTWDDTPYSQTGISYQYFCVNDTQSVNWQDDLSWENQPESLDFLDTHTVDTATGVGTKFLYELPKRSPVEYEPQGALDLRDTFTVDKNSYAVLGYNAVQFIDTTRSGKLEIPETVTYENRTYTVVAIGGYRDGLVGNFGLMGLHNITEITLPKTVKGLWYNSMRYMFENIFVAEENPYYTSVDGVLFTKSLYTLIQYPSKSERTAYAIPEETVRVGRYAFELTTNLESLTLGKNTSIIGFVNFNGQYRDDIGGAIISGGIPALFEAMTGKKELLIAEGNTKYARDDFAFYNGNKTSILYVYDKEITSFEVPANVKDIETLSSGSDVFTDCLKLEKFTVAQGNERYVAHDGILYNKNGTSIVSIPKAIKGEVEILEGVTELGLQSGLGRVFNDCKELTSVILPKTLTMIGATAFIGCEKLESVVIPSSVTTIYGWAFLHCDALKTVFYDGTAREWENIVVEKLNEALTAATVYYYSETGSDTRNDLWHYDENSKPVVW